jgi:hypothetical protein
MTYVSSAVAILANAALRVLPYVISLLLECVRNIDHVATTSQYATNQ